MFLKLASGKGSTKRDLRRNPVGYRENRAAEGKLSRYWYDTEGAGKWGRLDESLANSECGKIKLSLGNQRGVQQGRRHRSQRAPSRRRRGKVKEKGRHGGRSNEGVLLGTRPGLHC